MPRPPHGGESTGESSPGPLRGRRRSTGSDADAGRNVPAWAFLERDRLPPDVTTHYDPSLDDAGIGVDRDPYRIAG